MNTSELERLLDEFNAAIENRELSRASDISQRLLSEIEGFNHLNQNLAQVKFKVLSAIAGLEEACGSADCAIEHYLDLIELGKEHEQFDWKAEGFKQIGLVHCKLGDFERASLFLHKALDILRFPEFENTVALADVLKAIVFLKRRICEQETQSLWQEAAEIYNLHGIEI